MKKKFGIIMMAVCICFGILYPGRTAFAASGATSVAVSSGSVNIGDTVTVTAKASGASGEKAVATMTLSYDSGILQFVSCSASTYGGGGNSVTVAGDSFTVTLKAVAAGTSAVSLSASDGVLFDSNEELESMSGSSASVTVKNEASPPPANNNNNNNAGGGNAGDGGGESVPTASADNSLKSLTISAGTLSPAFAPSKTQYTATVANDVTSIAVTAVPSNEKATVESVSGHNNLAVGANTIKVVVKAENGVTATYSINVTRKGAGEESPQEPQEPETETGADAEVIAVNGVSYKPAEDFAAEEIPADFSETTVNYHGTEYKGVSYDKGTLKMLCLTQTDAENAGKKFFVYDETRDTLYPFVKISNGEKYVIALLAPVDFVMPDTYRQIQLPISEGEEIAAYQKSSEETEIESDFSMFYGVNQDGSESWYRYDALEGTYQRCNFEADETPEEEEEVSNGEMQLAEYAALSEKYTKEKAFARTVMAVLAFIIAVLVIVIINLLLRNRGRDDDGMDDDDDGLDDDDDGLDDDDDGLDDDDLNNSGIYGADIYDAGVHDSGIDETGMSRAGRKSMVMDDDDPDDDMYSIEDAEEADDFTDGFSKYAPISSAKTRTAAAQPKPAQPRSMATPKPAEPQPVEKTQSAADKKDDDLEILDFNDL